MKRIFMPLLTLALVALPFSSCSSSKDSDDLQIENENKNYDQFPYSELTPEQQKEKLAADGRKVMNEIKDLNQSKAVGLLLSLERIQLPKFSDNFNGTGSIIYINEFYGKYTWDSNNDEWVKTDFADKLILHFPTSKNSTINNARVEATGVSSKNSLSGYELPKEMTANLFVDNKNVGTVEVKADGVNGNSVPKTADVKISIEAYSLEMNAQKDSEKLNIGSFKFMKGNTQLLGGKIDLAANLDEGINNENWDELSDGNLNIHIMNNLVIYGKVKAGDLRKKLEDAERYSDTYEEEYNQKAIAYNNLTNCKLAAVQDKVIIADIKVRSKEEYYYDYKLVPTLHFGDKSIVDAEVYFSDGFAGIISEWDEFVRKFQ